MLKIRNQSRAEYGSILPSKEIYVNSYKTDFLLATKSFLGVRLVKTFFTIDQIMIVLMKYFSACMFKPVTRKSGQNVEIISAGGIYLFIFADMPYINCLVQN